jgi:hypothetical protein
MQPKTFADLYCERHGVPRPRYNAVVFRKALFPHARLLLVVVRSLSRLHFLADHEFVEDVGHIKGIADFSYPLGSYIEHPANRGFLRRVLRLRVSARRLLQLVRSVYGTTPESGRRLASGTFEPFDDRPPGG